MTQGAAPVNFLPIGMIVGWASGVATIPLGNGLVKAGFTVSQTAPIVVAWTLPMALMFLWAPIVDSWRSRKAWLATGALIAALSSAMLYLTPWRPSLSLALIGFATVSGFGASIVSSGSKGVMAYHVAPERFGFAVAFYQAGNVLGVGGGAALTLWLLSHGPGRTAVAALIGCIPLLCASVILLLPREVSKPLAGVWTNVVISFREAVELLRSRPGVMAALVCIIPFGGGGAAKLFGAIAPEWHASSDLMAQIAAWAALSGVAGAFVGAWVITHRGQWFAYIAAGVLMMSVALVLAFVAENARNLTTGGLIYVATSGACDAAVYTIALSTIGRGAASTKAAVLVGLSNLSSYYPPLIEGVAHDHAGSRGVMLTEAGLGLAGLLLLLAVSRALRFSFSKPQVVLVEVDVVSV